MAAKQWEINAEKAFGPRWIIALREILDIDRRSIMRWSDGAATIPRDIETWLAYVARRPRSEAFISAAARINAAGSISAARKQLAETYRDRLAALDDMDDDPRLIPPPAPEPPIVES